ncbi:N-terminal acetyltransferase [Hypocenomyce scalaris]|nr:N-terminal acetyltransferase [Hypocenomyce scalaris]
MVNIVTLPTGPKYALDVSFGGDGPTHPLTLIPGHTSRNLDVQQVRLIHDNIPHQTDLSQKLWIYQYRNGAERERNSFDPLALRQQILPVEHQLSQNLPLFLRARIAKDRIHLLKGLALRLRNQEVGPNAGEKAKADEKDSQTVAVEIATPLVCGALGKTSAGKAQLRALYKAL